MFLPEENMFVSSANIINSDLLEVQCRSLIYTIKSKGSQIEPWGTPQLMSKKYVLLFFYHILCCFPLKRYLDNHIKLLSLTS